MSFFEKRKPPSKPKRRRVRVSINLITRYEEDPRSVPLHGPLGLGLRDSEARFGVEYGGGSRATLDDSAGIASRGAGELALIRGGGGGSPGRWSYQFWAEPLPPPGPVTFAVEWPSRGIKETTHSVEGERFIEAASHSKPVFTRDRRKPSTRG